MKELSFKVQCRSCKNINDMNTIIYVNENDFAWADGSFRLTNVLKSEYELGTIIRTYLKDSNQPCEYCGSFNLHIFDVIYDRERAYIFTGSDMYEELEMNIRKEGNRTSVHVAHYHPVNFVIESVNHILGQIKMFIEDQDFVDENNGYLNFIVTKRFEENRTISRIEQFDHSGYSREDALGVLNYIKLNAASFVD